MTVIKEIVCLANSIKHRERCIAGIDVETGAWIRPVGAKPGGAVSGPERQYWDGREPRVLDVISVPLVKAQADGFQRENWLLKRDARWMKIGRIGWDELAKLEEAPDDLWTTGYAECKYNDKVPEGQLHKVTDSLKLIRVDDVTMVRSQNQNPTAWAEFHYAGVKYYLSVTDPLYKRVAPATMPKKYPLGESFLTVSLGEAYKGYSYKLVAAIIERDRIEQGNK